MRIRELIASITAIACTACAAPYQRVATTPAATAPAAGISRPAGRQSVGVAFGGGSARGIAHIGVIRWFEEHRIPIDAVAGTSMGGLVGGAFSTGMDAGELQAFITTVDWDRLFGASTFAHKNIRRKADARAYPSRLEFGVRGGLVAPPALNDGQQVELFLGRIAAPYFDLAHFDELPTPYRAVAVDLLSASPVVLSRGSLAEAMRATMSLPLVFPPVEIDGQMLIDGGTMNNVPADVVRSMGADRVVAVNVGDLSDREGVRPTMFGLAGTTLDVMMRASTKRALESADVVINVPVADFGSLDWRRADELIEQGYRAAEAMRAELLPFAVGEAEFLAWQDARRKRRQSGLPAPAFTELKGFSGSDASRLTTLLARHQGAPLDISAVEADLAIVSGLDRYQTVTWQLVNDSTRGYGLQVQGRVKAYAPPFMMLGINLENTTSSDFRITATARYLAFDIVGSGSEVRVDGTVGSEPGVGFELYRPIRASPFFVAPYAGAARHTFDLIQDDEVTARYNQTLTRAGFNVGVNLGAHSDVRTGAYVGRTSASIVIGDPGFPELSGQETGAEIVWRTDTQDSPVVPASGVLAHIRLSQTFDSPDLAATGQPPPFDSRVTQLSATANRFWSSGPRNRLFAYGGFGTSFDDVPLPTDQFGLGTPFRLGAYDTGELRGANYYVGTAGYFRRVGRLPDFFGGPVFAGGWLENGDAFDEWSAARWRSNGGTGIVMDTLIGPVILAGSWSFDGRWRTYVGIGRLFR
jgi:NTE family protein